MLVLLERIDGDREMQISEAFTVATCARELGDMPMATTALRVIDALLNKRTPTSADVLATRNYFR